MAEAAPSTRSEERKTHIRECALRCFTRHGFHRAGMAEICAEAGMSPGNLYRYYDSKETIIAAIIEEEHARYAGLIAQALMQDDIIAGLISVAEVAFSGEGAAIEPKLYIEIMAEALRNPRIAEIMHKVDCGMDHDVGMALERAQKAGQIDAKLDPQIVNILLGSAVDGLIGRLQMLPESEHPRVIAGFGQMVRRYLAPTAPHLTQTKN